MHQMMKGSLLCTNGKAQAVSPPCFLTSSDPQPGCNVYGMYDTAAVLQSVCARYFPSIRWLVQYIHGELVQPDHLHTMQVTKTCIYLNTYN